MLKLKSGLEHKVDNRIANLIVDNDMPLEHIKEALFQFIKYVAQVEDKVKENQVAQKVAEEEIEKAKAVLAAQAANATIEELK